MLVVVAPMILVAVLGKVVVGRRLVGPGSGRGSSASVSPTGPASAASPAGSSGTTMSMSPAAADGGGTSSSASLSASARSATGATRTASSAVGAPRRPRPASVAGCGCGRAPCGLLAGGLLVGLAGEGGLLGEERLAVGLGDLVVVGVDFREGQEAVAVAAVVDEGRLQRRLDARDLGEVDVAGELPLVKRLEVEFLDPVPVHDHDAGLFRVRGIDQHFLGHGFFRERASRPAPNGRVACGVPRVERKRRDQRPSPGPQRGPDGQIASGPARFTAVLLRPGIRPDPIPTGPPARLDSFMARAPVAGVPGSSKTTSAVLQCRERATNTSTDRTACSRSSGRRNICMCRQK